MKGQRFRVTLLVTEAEYCSRLVLIKDRKSSLCLSDPVVSSLVFVVDPVEFFIRAVLKAVLSDPLVGIAAALSQDPRHDLHVPQVDLQPLGVVLKLGEPGTPAERTRTPVPVRQVYSTPKGSVIQLSEGISQSFSVLPGSSDQNHKYVCQNMINSDFRNVCRATQLHPDVPTRSPGC